MSSVWKRVSDAVVLPREITRFERKYLERVNRLSLLFFIIHLPALSIVAALNGTKPLAAIALSLLVLAVPFAANHLFENPRTVSLFNGCTAMWMGALLVHFGRGPAQVEMHFYVFALMAMLSMYGNPLVIVVAAATVAADDTILRALSPHSLLGYDAPVWVSALHTSVVMLEALATGYLARSFFDNVIGLEKIVQARTSEVASKNREMRLVLDHAGEGMAMINLKGKLSQQHSRMLERLLGPIGGEDFATVLDRHSPIVGSMFRLAWSEVIDGSMPLEASLDLLPKRLVVGARTCQLDYTPIFRRAEELSGCLLVVRDISVDLAREKLQIENRDIAALLDKIAADRPGVVEFFEESAEQILRATDEESSITAVRRAIHTVKGNAGMVGLTQLADTCDDLENQLSEEGAASVGRLAEVFGKARTKAGVLLFGHDMTNVHVDGSDLDEAIAACVRGESHEALAAQLKSWKLEPLTVRFRRVAEQIERLAGRLGKPNPRVVIKDGGARLPKEGWSSFWSALIHVVRNAMDHGIEYPEERLAAHKPAEGRIVLAATVQEAMLFIEIVDDGRGIDWEAVRQKATSAGLPVSDEASLSEALFANGLSTADPSSEISGRGVGMGAMRSECLARGGRMEIVSKSGEGTLVRLAVPLGARTSTSGADVWVRRDDYYSVASLSYRAKAMTRESGGLPRYRRELRRQ